MISAREAAFKTLTAFRKTLSWSSLYLGNLIQREKMDRRDAALAGKLSLGVLQNSDLLDFYISLFTDIKKLDPNVKDILRLSAYQLVFLDKIPPSAAVNEGVALTKKYANIGASKLVNAVLRKIADNSSSLPEPDDLSVKFSHPKWMTERFTDLFGQSGCEKILALNNTEPLTYIQINTLKTDTDKALKSLTEEGFKAETVSGIPDCVCISGGGNIASSAVILNGFGYVQDLAARLACITADCKENEVIIDGCSAPGGKSFGAAIAMKNAGKIYSCDIHANKLSLISSGGERLGIDIIETRALDAREFNPEFSKSGDTVIADVPCSGLGVIRKKPEIRYKKAEEIKNLPKIQLDIIKNLSSYVKPGGKLIYSTCTILPEENEGVINSFLAENSAFELEKFTLPEPFGTCDGYKTLLPHIDGVDGFFIARLRRKK